LDYNRKTELDYKLGLALGQTGFFSPPGGQSWPLNKVHEAKAYHAYKPNLLFLRHERKNKHDSKNGIILAVTI